MDGVDEPEIPELSSDQAYAIAGKIVEMAERVQRLDPAVPGAVAKWAFEMDDARFSVSVEYAGNARSTTDHE